MKFSAQEEYGIRCLLQIAEKGPDGMSTIPEIAKLEGITEPHAAKLLSLLRKGEFIKSTRGQSGGYRLSRSPEQITIGEVLNCLGGRLYDDGFCIRHSGTDEECVHRDDCVVGELWSRIQFVVDQLVNSTTLADVAQRRWAPGRENLEPLPIIERL
ncbi:MAG: Rrf2 family transcriptional regulator [Chthonomonas sp.]|nr:Rrf2 family transcriptional regulator [Chthonomonas sp.]